MADPNDPMAGNSTMVQGGDPGQQDQQGLGGVLGAKVDKAQGPNADAYNAQMGMAQGRANTYGNQSVNYTQNAPTIANQFQAQSQNNIANNVGQEQGLASQLMNNNGEASKAQFQQGLDQSINSQMAMANSASGGAVSQAGARRAAQQQGAQTQAQGASTAAQLGAQEREAALGQAGNVYGQIGGQLQSQYGLEQQNAQAQAQLQSTNQAQQNQMRLGMGGLANQAQGQSLDALNSYTQGNLQAQGLSEQKQQNATNNTNGLIGMASGLGGEALGAIGSFLAQGGPMKPGGGMPPAAAPAVAAVYGQHMPAQHAKRPATLAEALAGIEQLKAEVAKLARQHGR